MTASQQLGIDHAHRTQRCAHIHLTGRRCGSPALSGRRLCYFHDRARRPQRPNYDLPLLEDATSVQFALTQVVRALQDKALDPKTCALLLYALQTASANLKRLGEESRRQAADDAAPDPALAEVLLRELNLDPASALADDREPTADDRLANDQRQTTNDSSSPAASQAGLQGG